MNNKFLLDLAYWESTVGGEGSSVLHHQDWQFYDYNILKANPLFEEYRQSIGVYAASMYVILTPHVSACPLISSHGLRLCPMGRLPGLPRLSANPHPLASLNNRYLWKDLKRAEDFFD